MSRAAFIENVAKRGNISKAESKRIVDLVLGEIEAGLKKSKKEGRYTIGNFGTFTITKRCIAPGSLDTSLSHAAGLSDIAVCHA